MMQRIRHTCSRRTSCSLPWLALAALLLLQVGCGDEAIEAALCRQASEKICDKWFTCYPFNSAKVWLSRSNCSTCMKDWCASSESWSGCDVDNAKLRSCNNSIDQSACGSLPASCTDIFNCYYADR